MSTTSDAATAPIALLPDEGEALWFLGNLVTVKASGPTTNGGVAVLEHLGVRGLGSPLHLHRNEDEWFYIAEGELTFWIGDDRITAPAGSFVYGPRGIPHAFAISSEQARFIIVTQPAGFERFLRSLSVPAETRTLPPASVTPPAPEVMIAAAAEYGIEILGPQPEL